MKQTLLKTFLLAAGLLMGESVWSQTTLYEKGTTGNEWATSDLDDWTFSGDGTNLTQTINASGYLELAKVYGRYEYTSYHTLSTSDDYVVTMNLLWGLSGASGSNTAGCYVDFGDTRLFWCGQSGALTITIGSGETETLFTSTNMRLKDLNVTLSINKKTKSVSYSVYSSDYDSGNPIAGSGTSATGTVTQVLFGWARGGQQTASTQTIKQITITEEAAAASASVTYKYEDTDGNDLSTLKSDVVKSEDVGATVSELINSALQSSFYSADSNTRYDYSTYTCDDTTVPAGGTTVTLKFTPNAKFTYNVYAVNSSSEKLSEDAIATVSGYATDTKTLAWSKYVYIGSQWYVTSETTFYKDDITAAGSKNVVYSTSDIAYFYEMENLSHTGGQATTETSSSYSNYYRMRPTRNQTYYTPALSGGVYTLSIPWQNTNTSDNEVYVYTRTSGGVLSDALTTFTATNSGSGTFTYVITVPDGYSIAFNGNEGGSANNNARMDYMTLTPITSVSKTISSAGWATYCSPYALDFSSAIANLDAAYIVTGGADGVLTTEAVTTTVAANTGLLLKGSAGTVTIPVVASGTDYSATNKLVGVTVATEKAQNTAYVLMNDATNGLGFYLNGNATAFTVGANTAYLPSDFAASARGFFLLDGETTGIGAALVNNETMNKEVYNLNGQRVAAPQKGLYVVNGKKVIIK